MWVTDSRLSGPKIFGHRPLQCGISNLGLKERVCLFIFFQFSRSSKSRVTLEDVSGLCPKRW